MADLSYCRIEWGISGSRMHAFDNQTDKALCGHKVKRSGDPGTAFEVSNYTCGTCRSIIAANERTANP